MPKLASDLELLRMGLTFPEVMELAWHDPCWLLTSQTTRALLGVAMSNGSTIEQFLERKQAWIEQTKELKQWRK